MTRPETKAERLAVRLTPHQRARIAAAAAAAGQTVSEFATAAMTERADRVLTEQQRITLNAQAWQRLTRLLDEPPRPLPRLAELAARIPPWDGE